MRYEGPVKGYIVLVNDDTGESTLHIVEPLHLSGQFYDIMNSEYGKLAVKFGKDATFPNIIYGTPESLLSAKSVTLGTADGSTTTFNIDFGGEIVPNTVDIYLDDAKVASDDGNGNIVGEGITGTIDYSNGQGSVTFATAPASGTVKANAVAIG